MPFPSIAAANSILQLSFRDGIPLSPAKLQRILWFTAAEYAKTGRGPLLHERFEPWGFGPVARSVHDKFKVFGALDINVYGKDAAGTAHAVDLASNPVLERVLASVWERTSTHSRRTLTGIATWPGSAWWHTTDQGLKYIEPDDIAGDFTYAGMLGL